MIGVIETAGAVVAFLSPFMPYLKEAGKITGKKLVEVAAERGGDAALKKAQDIWGKLAGRSDSLELKSASDLVGANPEDQTYQIVLTKVLVGYLQKNPSFAKELVDLMGGEDSVQEVLAQRGSWIEDVRQEMSGTGRQSIKASDDAVIKVATQIKTK
jgi:hypothetical protein